MKRLIGITQMICLVCLIFLPTGFVFSDEESIKTFPETIKVLKEVYRNEIIAHQIYSEYAQKAAEEGYDNIADLFHTLSNSESIHAKNFKDNLIGFGVEIEDIPALDPEAVGITKENLKHALEAELAEINDKYPGYIEMVKDENHLNSIANMTYAWEAEKQHKALIRKMLKGTGVFFDKLVKIMEGESRQYYVCQRCGSTLNHLPDEACPICKGKPSQYKHMKMDIMLTLSFIEK